VRDPTASPVLATPTGVSAGVADATSEKQAFSKIEIETVKNWGSYL
jgi:hypothetical protein